MIELACQVMSEYLMPAAKLTMLPLSTASASGMKKSRPSIAAACLDSVRGVSVSSDQSVVRSLQTYNPKAITKSNTMIHNPPVTTSCSGDCSKPGGCILCG